MKSLFVDIWNEYFGIQFKRPVIVKQRQNQIQYTSFIIIDIIFLNSEQIAFIYTEIEIKVLKCHYRLSFKCEPSWIVVQFQLYKSSENLKIKHFFYKLWRHFNIEKKREFTFWAAEKHKCAKYKQLPAISYVTINLDCAGIWLFVNHGQIHHQRIRQSMTACDMW